MARLGWLDAQGMYPAQSTPRHPEARTMTAAKRFLNGRS